MEDSMKVAVTIVGMLIVGGLLFAKCSSDVSGRTREIAQREADSFIRETGLKAKAMCADRDTDGDGYVSCTLVTDDGRIEALECAGALTINNGCRAPKAVVRGQ